MTLQQTAFFFAGRKLFALCFARAHGHAGPLPTPFHAARPSAREQPGGRPPLAPTADTRRAHPSSTHHKGNGCRPFAPPPTAVAPTLPAFARPPPSHAPSLAPGRARPGVGDYRHLRRGELLLCGGGMGERGERSERRGGGCQRRRRLAPSPALSLPRPPSLTHPRSFLSTPASLSLSTPAHPPAARAAGGPPS